MMRANSIPTAIIDLPISTGNSALRAGLIAMGVQTATAEPGRPALHATLARIDAEPRTIAFVDISAAPASGRSVFLDLTCASRMQARAGKIMLTRLQNDHVSQTDRRWAQALGFADLATDLDPVDPEGELQTALAWAAGKLGIEPLSTPALRSALGSRSERPTRFSARGVIRSLTALGAEAFAALLHNRLSIADRTYRGRLYASCFVGADAVDWISRTYGCSVAEAITVGQALEALGLLVHVVHEQPFADAYYFYRLACSDAVDRLDFDQLWRGIRGDDGVAIADRRYRGTDYPQCWIGNEAVDRLVERHALSRTDAWLVMHRLMQFGLFQHVTNDQPFIDGYYFYRFVEPPPDMAP